MGFQEFETFTKFQQEIFIMRLMHVLEKTNSYKDTLQTRFLTLIKYCFEIFDLDSVQVSVNMQYFH